MHHFRFGITTDFVFLGVFGQPRPWWWEWEAARQPTPAEELHHNLKEAGVQVVLVTRWPRKTWPVQHAPLQSILPAEQLIYEDRYSKLWDLRPQ